MAIKQLNHFNGTNGATSSTDVGTNPATWTFGSAAALDTAQFKFGTSSIKLARATSDYTRGVIGDIGVTGSWTVEFWVRGNAAIPAFSTQNYCSYRSATQVGFTLGFSSSTGAGQFLVSGNGSSGTIAASIGCSNLNTTGVWDHIAIVRDVVAGHYYVYVNGVLRADQPSASNMFQASDFWIELGASNGANTFDGWFDEVAVSDTARYPGGTTFTPPTVEFVGTLSYSHVGTGGILVGGEAEVHPLDFSYTGTGGVLVDNTSPWEYQPITDVTGNVGLLVAPSSPFSYEPGAAFVGALNGLSVVLAVTGQANDTGDITFNGLSVLGDVEAGTYNTLDAVLNGLSVAAFDAMQFNISLNGLSVDTQLQPGAVLNSALVFTALSVAGDVSSEIRYTGALTLDLMHVEVTLVSEVVGTITIGLPPMRVSAQGYAGRIGSMAVTFDQLSVSAQGWPDAAIAGQLTFTGLSIQGIIEEILTAVFNTMNMSLELGGDSVTEFDGYNFNAYAKFNGAYVGSGPNGLYELDNGSDDDGSPIVASLLGGVTDFDSEVQVRVPYAYVAARTNGKLALVTRTSERTERKHTIGNDGNTALHRRRVQLDASPKSLEWQFGVENIEGSDFTIAQLSLLSVRTDRRI